MGYYTDGSDSDSDDGMYQQNSDSGSDGCYDNATPPTLNRGFLNYSFRSMDCAPQLRDQLLQACCTFYWRLADDGRPDDQVIDMLEAWCDDGEVNVGMRAMEDPRYMYVHFGPFDKWSSWTRSKLHKRMLVLRVCRHDPWGEVCWRDNRCHKAGDWYLFDDRADKRAWKAANTLRYNVQQFVEKRHPHYTQLVHTLQQECDDLCYDHCE